MSIPISGQNPITGDDKVVRRAEVTVVVEFIAAPGETFDLARQAASLVKARVMGIPFEAPNVLTAIVRRWRAIEESPNA